MGKRTRLEIQMDIIAALDQNPKGPTKLMQLTDLSWVVMQDCLKVLVANGMVLESRRSLNRKVYSLTTKGNEVIDTYRQIAREVTPIPIGDRMLVESEDSNGLLRLEQR
ncbi:MAG: winged helix-turn-helix domain-containing protein [Nitrososphaerales archaeon]